MYEKRLYRNDVTGSDLIAFQIAIDASDLQIYAQTDISDALYPLLKALRGEIESVCDNESSFETSLLPLDLKVSSVMVNHMLSASKTANVGPMASVAGAISEYLGKEAIEQELTDEIIIENGGDLYIDSKVDRKILVYAGKSPLSNRVALSIRKEQMPIGICTSAGTIGHSLSFGKADAVVVISKDTLLADATATAIGNIVKSSDDIDRGIEYGKNIKNVIGILIIIDDKLGIWGDVEIVSP